MEFILAANGRPCSAFMRVRALCLCVSVNSVPLRLCIISVSQEAPRVIPPHCS